MADANPSSPSSGETELDPELLKLLRCPETLQQRGKRDADAKLTLVKGCWLVCEASGNKYPIVDGIPVMLVDEGQKWRETAVEELPVPPPVD